MNAVSRRNWDNLVKLVNLFGEAVRDGDGAALRDMAGVLTAMMSDTQRKQQGAALRCVPPRPPDRSFLLHMNPCGARAAAQAPHALETPGTREHGDRSAKRTSALLARSVYAGLCACLIAGSGESHEAAPRSPGWSRPLQPRR